MKRSLVIGLAVGALGIAALQATPSLRNPPNLDEEVVDEPESVPEEEEAPAPRVAPKQTAPAAEPGEDQPKPAEAAAAAGPEEPQVPRPPALPPTPPPKERPSSLTPVKFDMPAPPKGKSTPMADRIAVVGLLNKRNGLWRDLMMKPGEARRVGDVVVRLRACETSTPWEKEQLTGAFVQLLVNDTDKKWRRYFSGWLYKESPSLNVVEHPVYDVWTKECRMRHSDIGENTTVVRGGDAPKERKGKEDEEG